MIITNMPGGAFVMPKKAANTAAMLRVRTPSATALHCGCVRSGWIVYESAVIVTKNSSWAPGGEAAHEIEQIAPKDHQGKHQGDQQGGHADASTLSTKDQSSSSSVKCIARPEAMCSTRPR